MWYQGHNLILTNLFFRVVPTTVMLMIALSLLLNCTRLVREMRALADNLSLARVISSRSSEFILRRW